MTMSNFIYAALAVFIFNSFGFQLASMKEIGSIEPVPPFYFTSSGDAGLKYPELMGVYEQSEKILNHLPVYKQLDGPGNIFAHKFGLWVVSKTLDDSDKRPLIWSSRQSRYNRLGQNSSPIPYSSGWVFYDEECRTKTRKNQWACDYSFDLNNNDDGYEGDEYVLDSSLGMVPTESGPTTKILELVLDTMWMLEPGTMKNYINLNHYLPEDFDADRNGEISKEEIELKIKEYIKFIFDHLDKDNNTIIIQDEFQNARIDTDLINKIVDIAIKSFPIKNILGHGDRNQDGFISEDDLLLPEKGNEGDEGNADSRNEENGKNAGNWSVKGSVLQRRYDKEWNTHAVCADSIGAAEGQVLCRQLGHIGFESLSPIRFQDYAASLASAASAGYYPEYMNIQFYIGRISCRGNEASLEECLEEEEASLGYGGGGNPNVCHLELLASVTCKHSTEIGEIVLKGGKDSSMGALYIGEAKYGAYASENMARVVCRQLGFLQGTPQNWTGQFFLNEKSPEFGRKFECNGSEQRLEDCQLLADINQYPWSSAGIICNSTFKIQDEELTDKYGDFGEASWLFQYLWDSIYARHFFIADSNLDGKVSREEIKDKVKNVLGAILVLLDQTDDGFLSMQDFTKLNIPIYDVHEVSTKLFEILTKGKMEISKAHFHKLVQNIDHFGYIRRIIWFFERHPGYFEQIYQRIDKSQQLTKMLAKTLDLNQNGLLEEQELHNFLSMIFQNLDSNQDNALHWIDVEGFLRKSHIFSCLQIEEINTFLEDGMKLIHTQAGKLLDYFFSYLDLNRNGEVSLEEIYKMPACSSWPRDPKDPTRCYDLFRKFYQQVAKPDFPTMEFNGTSFDEKIANSLCTAMQPAL